MSGILKSRFARTALSALFAVALGLQLIMATIHAAGLAKFSGAAAAGSDITTIVICTLYGPREIEIGPDGQPVDGEDPLPAGMACPICANAQHGGAPPLASPLAAPAKTALPATHFCRSAPLVQTSAHLRPPGRAPPLVV